MRIRNRFCSVVRWRSNYVTSYWHCAVVLQFYSPVQAIHVQKVIKLRYEVLKAVSITCQPHPPFLAATELATRSRVQMPAHKKTKKFKNFPLNIYGLERFHMVRFFYNDVRDARAV